MAQHIKPKTWLILTQYFPPEIGAPQLRLLAMIKELERQNIKVKVLTAMPNYPDGEILINCCCSNYTQKCKNNTTIWFQSNEATFMAPVG